MPDSSNEDYAEHLCSAVREAASAGRALQIQGCGTKAFYGRTPTGDVLSVAGHAGIVDYEPSELVLTARAGSSIELLETTLNQRGQTLPFEPPIFAPGTTLGGAVASGLSGPGRPYLGSARDFVLGIKCINGRGELLSFGGQVIKNVAGYDVSRLMTGALGTLGILLEVSLKVLPSPAHEETVVLSADPVQAIGLMNELATKPLPITAACHYEDQLRLRLAGSQNAVAAAGRHIGGDQDHDGSDFWSALRNHALSFFVDETPLWRLSVPPATPPMELQGSWLTDWGGAQRWLKTNEDSDTIRSVVAAAGGHAILFRGGDHAGEVFHPLAPATTAIHQNLKRAFDPDGILNPGRMYVDV
ncbi:MAG: glycolate oxidase subunit GlcE [Gammaproteobacteria bacterium]|nr:glycolate oxidase subunit GlcE [Gammaproteobacteria bacterium]